MWSTGHSDFITLSSHSWKRSSDCLPGDLYMVSKPLACMQCVGCVQKFARGFSELGKVVAPASLPLGIWLDCIYLTRVAQCTKRMRFMRYRVRVTKWPSNDNQDQHPYKSVVSFRVQLEGTLYDTCLVTSLQNSLNLIMQRPILGMSVYFCSASVVQKGCMSVVLSCSLSCLENFQWTLDCFFPCDEQEHLCWMKIISLKYTCDAVTSTLFAKQETWWVLPMQN